MQLVPAVHKGLLGTWFISTKEITWLAEKQQCLLGVFLHLLSDELQIPGMVVAEKLLVGCRHWTRS